MGHDAVTDVHSISVPKQRTRQTSIILIVLCLLTLGTRVVYAFITPINAARDEWYHIATKLVLGQGYVSSGPKTYIQPAYLNIPDYQFPVLPTATRVPVPVLYFALMCRLFGMAGVLGGLGILTRPTLIVLPLFLFPVLIVRLRRRLRQAVLACAALALGGAIVLAPWVYRNYLVFHEFVPTGTLGGLNLFRENYLLNRDDYLTFRDIPILQQTSRAMFDRRFGSVAVVETADQTQLLIDRTYREEALAKIFEYPGRYISLSLMRGLRLWFNVGYGVQTSQASYLILIGHLVLIGLTVKAFTSYRDDWTPKEH